MKRKFVCVHLFNNYSGSPKVLKQIVELLVLKGVEVDLITNKTDGFLSNIQGVNYKFINYNWSKNKILTFVRFFWAQIVLFFIVIKYNRTNSTLYINTITPAGAAIAGKCRKMSIIFHVHEKYVKSNIVNLFCQYIFEITATKSIFVSNYLKQCYTASHLKDTKVIYNSLDSEFDQIANKWLISNRSVKSKSILMLCSLRSFKGIYEFVKLANLLPQYEFELILSANEEEVQAFKDRINCGRNLQVYSNQTDLHPFFQRSKLLLNLSNPDYWIETFGLTILEAMGYGIPAIVPFVGGPIELIINEFNGYHVDPRNINSVKSNIQLIMSNNQTYTSMSDNALIQKDKFNNTLQMNEIEKYILN